MDDIYTLRDSQIQEHVGRKLKADRLKQNITQERLAESAGLSLSSVKKIEQGRIGSFDSFIRVLRVLGELNAMVPFMEQDELSPNEYYEFIYSARKHQRQRASKVKSSEE